MTTYYFNSNNGAPWQADHVYALDDIVICSWTNSIGTRAARLYKCTTAGTSDSTEPIWQVTTPGVTTTADNDVVWTCYAPTSWDLAHPSLIRYMANTIYQSAGDILKVHNTHAEVVPSTDFSSGMATSGLYNNPAIIVCVDKDNSDALSTGAVITSQRTAKAIQSYVTSINIKWVFSGNITSAAVDMGWVFIGDGSITVLELNGAANYFGPSGSTNVDYIVIDNGNVKLTNAANYLRPFGFFMWKRGTLIAPNGVTKFIDQSAVGGYKSMVRVSNVDLSAVGAGNLVSVAVSSKVDVLFTRCKLPETLATYIDSFENTGYKGVVQFHHCSFDQKTHGFREEAAEGTIGHETSIVRTGGASDSVTPISWKMVTTAAVNEMTIPLQSPSINLWNALTSAITLTVHGILDSATNLQDDEVWLEVEYPADTTSGLGAVKTTQKIYEGIADLSASTETWAESMANPNKFKLAATFTPAQAGPIAARVCVGKASTTIYVCPKAVIS